MKYFLVFFVLISFSINLFSEELGRYYVNQKESLITELTFSKLSDEIWTCASEVVDTDSELNGPCWGKEACGKDTHWACYQVIKETCSEQNSGYKKVINRKRFVGCYESLSDCW